MFQSIAKIDPARIRQNSGSIQDCLRGFIYLPVVDTDSKYIKPVKLRYRVGLVNNQEIIFVSFGKKFLANNPLHSECFIFDLLTQIQCPVVVL